MTHLPDVTDNCIVSMSVGCVSAEVRFTPNIYAGACVCVCVCLCVAAGRGSVGRRNERQQRGTLHTDGYMRF